MKPLTTINKLGTLRNISVAGSILTPLIDNRFVPYPYMMIWVITRRCNARCTMCSIWKEKDSPFLSLEQAEQILSGNDFHFVRSLTLTGGEPTLRNDLPELFELSLKYMPNLEHFLLATSGLNTRRTIDYVDKMLAHLESVANKVYRYDVQISLDGIGEVHDEVRGIDGFFDNVQKTIHGLRGLQERYPRLNLKLSSVLMPQNMPHVESLHSFAREQNLPIHYSPVVLDGAYYNNLHGVNNLILDSNNQQEIGQEFFERMGNEEQGSLRYYYKDMAKMIGGAKRGRTCMMGYFGFVLEFNANVYPCVNCERKTFGNLLQKSFDEVWFQGNSDQVREELRTNCCPTCTSMCFPPPANAGEVIDLAWRKLTRR